MLAGLRQGLLLGSILGISLLMGACTPSVISKSIGTLTGGDEHRLPAGIGPGPGQKRKAPPCVCVDVPMKKHEQQHGRS